MNFSSRGARATVGLPGTGLSYSTKISAGSSSAIRKAPLGRSQDNNNPVLTSTFDDEDFIEALRAIASNLSLADLKSERARFQDWVAACEAGQEHLNEDKVASALDCFDSAISEKSQKTSRSLQVFVALSLLSAVCLSCGLESGETGATMAGLLFGVLAMATPLGRAIATAVTGIAAAFFLLAVGGVLLYVCVVLFQAVASH